jgi:dCMP deaminase
MFVGIAGPICSGKRTIADFLISNHGFVRLCLRDVDRKGLSGDECDAIDTLASTSPIDDVKGLSKGIQSVKVDAKGDIWFDFMGQMVDYVTKRWRENFVTVDIWTEDDLEIVIKRPFFLLISVDSPVGIRWKRFNERYS